MQPSSYSGMDYSFLGDAAQGILMVTTVRREDTPNTPGRHYPEFLFKQGWYLSFSAM